MSDHGHDHEHGDCGCEEGLPLEVHQRVNALRRLQAEAAQLDSEFHKAVLALDLKYNELKQPLFNKRKEIVAGTYQPTDEEATPLPDQELPKGEAGEAPVTGIPSFWLTALSSHPYVDQLIEPHDRPVLESLVDIKLEWLPVEQPGYRLIFTFAKNEYFSDETLTKTYYMNYNTAPTDVLCDGPTYVRAEGCQINWNDGKDTTVRIEKKKQKKKGGKDAGKTRTVTKTVPQDSFFHFFKPPQIPEDADESSDELGLQRAMLSQDFDIGDIMKDRIIPNAVLYFTNEANEEDYDDDQFGEEGDDGDHPDDEDDDDEEDEPAPKAKGKGGNKAGGAPPAGQNPECKQQ